MSLNAIKTSDNYAMLVRIDKIIVKYLAPLLMKEFPATMSE